MKALSDIFEDMNRNVTNVFDCFEIPEDDRNMNIINEIYDDYWFVSENSLNYAKTENGFETGEYYCTEDDCDNAVFGQWEKDGFVAIKIGCGEHKSSELWVFRKDRMVDPDNLDLY